MNQIQNGSSLVAASEALGAGGLREIGPAPSGPASGFGLEVTREDYRRRIDWEAWAAAKAREDGHEEVAQCHDMARAAYITRYGHFALHAAVTAAIQGWRGTEENPASEEAADKAACVLRVAVREFEAGHWYSASTLAEVATDIVAADRHRTLAQWSAYDEVRYMLGDAIDAARAAAKVAS